MQRVYYEKKTNKVRKQVIYFLCNVRKLSTPRIHEIQHFYYLYINLQNLISTFTVDVAPERISPAKFPSLLSSIFKHRIKREKKIFVRWLILIHVCTCRILMVLLIIFRYTVKWKIPNYCRFLYLQW